MARTILVLILALPALAQLKPNTIDIVPSGGAVGRICFLETVANGANKVCLVGPASQGSDTTIDVTALGASYDYTPTALNNTTWERGLHISVNSADSQTIIQSVQGVGQFTADALQVANDCPSTSTNWECGGLSAALTNGSTTTHAVALRAYTLASADGSAPTDVGRVRMWPLNTLCDDRSFANIYCITELDFNIFGSNTKVTGMSMGGAGTGTVSSDSVAFLVNDLKGLNPSGPKWPTGFATIDGGADVALGVGLFTNANNSPSQLIYMWAKDGSGNVSRGILQEDPNGNFVISTGPLGSPVYMALLASGRLVLPFSGATLSGDLLFDSTSARNIGDATNYVQTIYTENIDAAPSGVTGNYANVRKLNVFDKNGGTAFYDIQAQHAVSASNLVIRDPSGADVLRLDRVLASVTVDIGTIDMNWVPATDHARSLGAAGLDWLDIRWDGNLIHNGTTVINSSRQWAPASFLFASDGSSSIGSSSANRPGTIHVGAGTAGGAGVIVYNGTVARMLVAPPYLSLYDNSSVEVIRLDSNSGDAIFTGAITVASCTGCGSGSLPVTDTTGIAKGSSDATKIVRFEVDTLVSSGATRILTVPNSNITIAGIDLAQTWTAAQTFNSGIVSSTIQAGTLNFIVDSSGNTEVLSLTVNGTTLINSSRQWIGDLLFSTDGAVSIGTTTGRPASVNVTSELNVFSGSTQRVNIGNTYSLWKNSASATKVLIDSDTGDIYSYGSYVNNGNIGVTQTSTVRNSAGTGTCTLIYSGGIRTGGTC